MPKEITPMVKRIDYQLEELDETIASHVRRFAKRNSQAIREKIGGRVYYFCNKAIHRGLSEKDKVELNKIKESVFM